MTEGRRSFDRIIEQTKHKPAEDRTAIIRRLNDQLRVEGIGGREVVTSGVAALGILYAYAILAEIAAFDSFTPDNDPYGEHDCALMEIADHQIIWKIDYYDKSCLYGSPDPADPTVTTRVLTVMLAGEY